MLGANNLSDVADAAVSRANLGLGAAALQANSFFAQAANNLSDLANAATALSNLGGMAKSANLSDVANAATALANLFGSTPVIPSGATGTTQATNDNSTKLATTAYVKSQPFPQMTSLGVGSLAMASQAFDTGNGTPAGSTIAGSALASIGTDSTNTGDTLSGTWRALQSLPRGISSRGGLVRRIA